MANTFRLQGDYQNALAWHQRALDGFEKALGKEDASTLDTVNSMANTFQTKVIILTRRSREILGKGHPHTLDTAHNIANIFDFKETTPRPRYGTNGDLTTKPRAPGNTAPPLTAMHNIANTF